MPETTVIVNTSPLLYLHQVGQLQLLQHNLKYTGTLGILVKAKQRGYLSSVEPIIGMLQSQGMWLSDKIINDILRLCGEVGL